MTRQTQDQKKKDRMAELNIQDLAAAVEEMGMRTPADVCRFHNAILSRAMGNKFNN